MPRVPRLSKSRFQTGLQCPRSLWLTCHMPGLADEVSERLQGIFDQGHTVGALARERFPGGTLVAEDYTQSGAALATTARLLTAGDRCLYEAAFSAEEIFVRPDILVQGVDDRWSVVEVKSSTQAKPEHITDLGIQCHVLRRAGLPISSCGLLHLNNSYIYPGGPYDLDELFTIADVTDDVEQFAASIPALLTEMRRLLAGPMPVRQIGKHCDAPYTCSFYGYCHDFLPDFPVTEIPRLSDDALASLLRDGLHSIRDVPLTYPGLTPYQRTVCHVVQQGVPRFAPSLKKELTRLHEPVHFLDFETFSPALPLIPGTRPYEALPVQWSCHTLDGALTHQEFLHEETSDPRRPFAESLIAALGGDGPIVIYSQYENTILNSLAASLPDLAPSLARVQARLFDLERLVRGHVQHPDFHGRTSLKYVLPALVESMSYDHLAIADGGVASMRYGQAVFGEIPHDQKQATFCDLREYCATDTLGLARLYETLCEVC